MRKILCISLLCIITLFLAFCENSESAVNQSHEIQAPDILQVTSNFRTWYNYHYANIHLGGNFTGETVEGKTITREAFLQQLRDENYLALHTGEREGIPVYKLAPIDSTKSDIRTTIREEARQKLFYLGIEGKDFPAFDFTDLDGRQYSNSSTNGKYVFIKCWFIKCVACIEEFPELNEFVAEHNNRDDLVFLSLALDDAESLREFLKVKPLAYATVPEMEAYLTDQLSVGAYPTHFLIGKDGKILKMTNKFGEIEAAFAAQ